MAWTPSALEIEITEEAILDPALADEQLKQLEAGRLQARRR
ncbi:MAG: hypothetical protein U5N27_05730 [Rhizobium sp.]|nr:hypothetical protein [Rhizobium sp.]